jgi:hypothetical protein
LHSVVDARGNFHFLADSLGHIASPAALLARLGDGGAASLARGTGRLHAEDSRRLHDLAVPAAVLAGRFLAAGAGAASFAGVALLVPAEFYGLVDSASRFLQL